MQHINNIVPSTLSAARSDVLDAFADLEYSVIEALKAMQLEISCSNAPLGQKLEKLAGLKPTPKLSKASAKIITDAASKAQSLNEIRNDIVHSRLRSIANHPEIAIYLNARTINQPYPTARVMTIDQHAKLAVEVRAVTTCLTNFRNAQQKATNPPSQPQPSPDAAAGP